MLSKAPQTLVITSASLLLHSSSAAFNLFKPEPRIIGGVAAPSQRYPYTVALTNGGSDFFCSGSLMAVDMVLTAAHYRRRILQRGRGQRRPHLQRRAGD